MSFPNLPDAALILVGHGSTQNADSSAPVYQHGAELRRRRLFNEVRECFWKVEPGIHGVLDRVSARRIFVVPLFISNGYFTDEAIPAALGLRADGQESFARVQSLEGRTIHYCQPVGTHPRMTSVVLARAESVVKQFPFPRAPNPASTTLFLAGHGTGRNDNSRKSVEHQVGIIRSLHRYAEVHAVFMLEEPQIADCWRIAKTRNLVLVPYFISDGLHVSEDIPVLLGEAPRVVQERLGRNLPTWRNPTERHGKLTWVTPGVGTEPLLADVILDRVKESLAESA